VISDKMIKSSENLKTLSKTFEFTYCLIEHLLIVK